MLEYLLWAVAAVFALLGVAAFFVLIGWSLFFYAGLWLALVLLVREHWVGGFCWPIRIGVVVLVAFGVPVLLNWDMRRTVDELRSQDVLTGFKVSKDDRILLDSHRAFDGYDRPFLQTPCGKICQHLLYNDAVAAVYARVNVEGGEEYWRFRKEARTDCPAVFGLERSVLYRVAAGECLVTDRAVSPTPTWRLDINRATEHNIDSSPFRPRYTSYVTELIRLEAGEEITFHRRTRVDAYPIFIPLLVGVRDLKSGKVFLFGRGIRHFGERLVSIDRIARDLLGPIVEEPARPTDDLFPIAEAALTDPERPASAAHNLIFDLLSDRDYLPGPVDAKYVDLVVAAIADDRVSKVFSGNKLPSGGLLHLLAGSKDAPVSEWLPLELAEVAADRMLREPEKYWNVRTLDSTLWRLPADRIATIGARLRQMADEPSLRLAAARSIPRLADIDPESVDFFADMLRRFVATQADGENGGDENAVKYLDRLGLRGLCRHGPAASDHSDLVMQYYFGITPRRYLPIRLVSATMIRLGRGAEFRARLDNDNIQRERDEFDWVVEKLERLQSKEVDICW